MNNHTMRASIKRLLGINRADRQLTVNENDVFVVSYPKSGNTWTRFLIANLTSDEEATFLNMERRVPDIYQNSDRQLLALPAPRILKSHEYFDPRYKKVIYIVRDPRDVAVSYYYHFLKFQSMENATIADFTQWFLDGKLDVFGSWGENVGSWLGAREHDPNFLLVRYEDLLKDTKQELRTIASFLQLKASEDRLNRTIRLSSADHMRSMEQKQAGQWKITKNSRKDIQFVRSAKSGEWTQELAKETADQIESKWIHLLHKLDYVPQKVRQ